MDLEETQ